MMFKNDCSVLKYKYNLTEMTNDHYRLEKKFLVHDKLVEKADVND